MKKYIVTSPLWERPIEVEVEESTMERINALIAATRATAWSEEEWEAAMERCKSFGLTRVGPVGLKEAVRERFAKERIVGDVVTQ